MQTFFLRDFITFHIHTRFDITLWRAVGGWFQQPHLSRPESGWLDSGAAGEATHLWCIVNQCTGVKTSRRHHTPHTHYTLMKESSLLSVSSHCCRQLSRDHRSSIIIHPVKAFLAAYETNGAYVITRHFGMSWIVMVLWPLWTWTRWWNKMTLFDNRKGWSHTAFSLRQGDRWWWCNALYTTTMVWE